jgi:beta-galactosidase
MLSKHSFRKAAHLLLLLVPLILITLNSMVTAADQEEDPKPWRFPSEFFIGTAISGFQAEMGCPNLPERLCDDTNSDWYAYATSDLNPPDPFMLSGQDPAEVGPGFWELYPEDMDRAAYELNNNSLRMSIEWSRIFPTPTDECEDFGCLMKLANKKALLKYRLMFHAMKKRGLIPMVTLNHYTLPLWIHDPVAFRYDYYMGTSTCQEKGWVDRERIVREIAKFAGFVARVFGRQVDHWATLNEPMAVVVPGYLFPSEFRTNPPGVSPVTPGLSPEAVVAGFETAKTVIAAMIEAHARMYDAVKLADKFDADRDGNPAQVGLVFAMIPTIPIDPEDDLDTQAANNMFYLLNQSFLDGTCLGMIDENLDGNAEYREDLDNRIDFLGINYYYALQVTGVPDPIFPDLSPLTTFTPDSMGAFIYFHPQGMFDMVMFVHQRYDLPIYITENGTPLFDENYKPIWIGYMVSHLMALIQATWTGADIRGYYYWTLMDNYEWNHGMLELRFGLYAVDPADSSKMRVPRYGVPIYADIAEYGGIPTYLFEMMP